jgi:hypothetical protein
MHIRFLALAMVLFATHAHAELYCVTTNTQLMNAIASAQGGGASQIRMRTGTYLLATNQATPALSIVDTSDLSISGGWNTGCTAQTASSPDQTILNALSSGRLLDIEYPTGSSHEISFSMLSFRGGMSSSPLSAGCVYAESLAGSNARLIFELVSFRGCTNSGGSAALRVDLDGVLFALRSSVASGNSYSGNNIFLRGLGGSTFTVTNNTITSSSNVTGAGIYLAGLATDFFRLSNNIVHANGPFDLFVESNVFALLNNNHIGVTSVIPVGVTVNAMSTGDPGFVTGSLHLKADSPARNSGLNAAPGGLPTTDFSLNPRILGGQVDRGAYEFDGFFANGFE